MNLCMDSLVPTSWRSRMHANQNTMQSRLIPKRYSLGPLKSDGSLQLPALHWEIIQGLATRIAYDA